LTDESGKQWTVSYDVPPLDAKKKKLVIPFEMPVHWRVELGDIPFSEASCKNLLSSGKELA
jgi:hypothetical protein